MKKPKKLIVIAAITITLAGSGAYIGLNKNAEAKQQQQMNLTMNTLSVEKGNIKSVVSAGGKVSLIDAEGNNPNAIKIIVSVNQYDVSQLEVNQIVEINAKAFPDETIKGTITEISNKAEEGESPTYNVTVAVSNLILEVGESKYEEISVRKGPSKEYGKVAKIEKGDKFHILERKGSWMRVRLEDNTQGWIQKHGVKLEGIDKKDVKVKIASNDTILRKNNASNSKSLGKLLQGEEVAILDKKENWYKVETSDKTIGWILENNLTIQSLKDGMSVTGTIIINEKNDVIKIPVMAVQKDEKGYFVTLASTSEKKYIETGITDSEYIEVTKGLSENESISIQSFKGSVENSGAELSSTMEKSIE
ncbi:SH3 domain-containing protein [Clostridioides sp. ES-S-0001-03]|uniref:SH3 domain-containing protein n=1 Tax=Clostridioides sp. ES-S-0001-03 TaxID=2770771 RepID=UPI001D0C1976|nr:SH3 domain-containing protein [Clostridioides sp. ES-S-0001-03]